MAAKRLHVSLIIALGFVLAVGLSPGLGRGVDASAAGPVAPRCDIDDEYRASGDLDGDRSSDIAVRVGRSEAVGVDVRATATPPTVIAPGSLGTGVEGGPDSGYGSAMAIGDLDADGCADLVIGSPGASAVLDETPGEVEIAFGSFQGVTPSGALRLPHDSSSGDRFGSALALVQRREGLSVVHDLYVGAPGASVNGQHEAGEVSRYTITAGGADRVGVQLREVRHQDSVGVPGAAEPRDHFGSVLAGYGAGYFESVPPDPSGVLVGVPDEDVGSAADAGAVLDLRTDVGGATAASQMWSQATSGVPGAAERRDHFGAAVSGSFGRFAVGVPDENDGRLFNSGAVQLFVKGPGGTKPAQLLTQNSAGVPGKVERGDRFGAAVAAGKGLLPDCFGELAAGIGAPGEDVGRRVDVGTVTLMPVTVDFCAAKPVALRQGRGLAGTAEFGDQVGGVLGVLPRGNVADPEGYAETLLIGVPWEQLGAHQDAGIVQPARGGLLADGRLVATLRFSRGYLLATEYGSSLPSPARR